jgi:hypothetical protein
MAPQESAILKTAIVAEDESIYLVKQRAAGANCPAQRHQLAKRRWSEQSCHFCARASGSIFLLSWFPD